MKQVLFIAYYFPPLGGAGVQRTLKFVKYLREFGWNASVLTVYPHRGALLDPTLLNEVPPDTKIYRSRAPTLPNWIPWRIRNTISRWLLVIDGQIGWLPFAVRRGEEILRSSHIDVLLSTSSPYTSQLIGYQLRDFAQVPWIADFRDPWMDNFTLEFPTRMHESLSNRFEHRVITRADRTLVVSEPMREAILNRYAGLPDHQVITLPNGYDPADFVNAIPQGKRNSKFTITYTGSFYANARSPSNFLTALKKCLDRQCIPRDMIQVVLVGNLASKINADIHLLELSDVIQTTGYVPHQSSIAYLLQSDLQLLIIGSLPGSQAIFTGKIFEYLASNKPILTLAPPGAASDLIREAHAGAVVAPDDIDEIANRLCMFYTNWESGLNHLNSDPSVIQRYDRRRLTRQLAEILDKLV
jgi:glycosyltransferase involved in cell wall biosynthesis